MKKLFLIFLFTALTGSAWCQLTQSTIGQIYNFSVGDTFECNCNYGNEGCGQSMGYQSYVILARQDEGEFITYTIKAAETVWGEGCGSSQDSSQYNVIYGPVDSAIFWYHTYHALGCDSNGYCYTDTVYIDTSNQRNWKVNEHKEAEALWGSVDTSFADGLGQVWYSFGDEETGQSAACQLTYYHKLGQRPWGSYFDIRFPTGIDEIEEKGASVKAFPNPFNDVTHIVVTGLNEKFGFELYDVTGRLQQSIPSVDNNQFDVHKGQLANSVYLYRILVTGKPAAYGKLVVE